MIISMVIAYDGTAYCGWQVQKNEITVQSEVERALKELTGEEIKVTASGRTDAGVHALGQVISFETNSTILPKNFYKALNTVLPSDIKALSSKLENEGFNARYTAKRKTYIYSIYQGNSENPLKERYATYIPYKLDIEKMQLALNKILGRHDFKAFQASGSSVVDTVREIYEAKAYFENGEIKISVTGNGFLYNMVRNIAGLAVAVGEGKLTLCEVEEILTSGERNNKFKTLDAKGLTLYCVEY